MDLEQLTPLSICRSDGSDMDLSGISVTVDDCLDQDLACILSVAKMFGKRLSAQDIRMQQNQIFVGLDQFISHLLFKSMLSIMTKTSLCIKYHCYLFK